MRTKQWKALLAAGVLSVFVLTACTGAQETAETAQTAAAATQTAVQTEAATQTAAATTPAYRAAYAGKLAELRAEFGTPEGEYDGQQGVLFADLLDWDADGTPELLALVHEGVVDDQDTFRLHVYGERDGEAVSLLEERVGSVYGNLSSMLDFGICRGASGKLTILVNDSHEYADLKQSYYTLSDGKVDSTVLTAQSSVGGWEGEGSNTKPVDPDAYQIDGVTCKKAEFEAKEKALDGASVAGVFCQHVYDLQELDAFLSGQSETYAGGALLEADDWGDTPVDWLPDAVFTVGS